MKSILCLMLLFAFLTNSGEGGTVKRRADGEVDVQEEVFTVEVLPQTDPTGSLVTGDNKGENKKPTSAPTAVPTTPPASTVSTTTPKETTTTTPELTTTTTMSTTEDPTTPMPTTTTTLPTTTTTKATTVPKIPSTATTTTSTTSKPTPAPTSTTSTTTATTTTSTTTEPTTTLPPTTTEEPTFSCPGDIYCEGKLFPEDILISGRHVACDPAPAPKDHCCLPHGKHLVCYNITVDGYHLNFVSERPAMSTDYMELCDVLVKSQSAVVGAYSTISTARGGGELAYRYGEWAIVRPTRHQVKDVACMIIEPTQPPKKLAKKKQNEGKKEKISKENDTSDQNQVVSPTPKKEN